MTERRQYEPLVIAGTGSRSLITKPLPHIKAVFYNLLNYLGTLWCRHLDLVVISGGAEGWDEALCHAAGEHGVPYHLYLPNKTYGAHYWSKASQLGRDRTKEFERLVCNAAHVEHVCNGVLAADGTHSNFARNAAMVAVADEFVVYNPTSKGTAHCLRLIKRAEKPYTIFDETDAERFE